MRHQATVRSLFPEPAAAGPATAEAYNEVGDNYLRYADGDPASLYVFDSRHAYGDRCIWALIDAKLVALRSHGRESIHVLDAGCGPGTWLRRIVARARELGFRRIFAHGFDLAEGQVERARALSEDIAGAPGVRIVFEVGDLTQGLAEADGSIDLALCLYGVLNHIPTAALPGALAEFARVTRGWFVASVRAAGSTPSIFIDSVENARTFRQDNGADRCDIELNDGRRVAIGCHLFAAQELRRLAGDHFLIEDMRGLDIFHGRFAPDPRWNPQSICADEIEPALLSLEEAYARRPAFIDRAAHLLLVGRPH